MPNLNRRNFLKLAALSSAAMPKYSFCFNGFDDSLKIAIVGCGRSGRRAAETMAAIDKNISIIALADAFSDCAFGLRDHLRAKIGAQNPSNKKLFDVPDSRVFVGLDAYKRAVESDCDIVVFATPPVFRPEEFEAAIAANKHSFLEKPLCVDPVGARRIYAAAKAAESKKLCAAVGYQRRYHAGYREAIDRLRDGQIGRLVHAQCFWFLPHFDGMELKTPPRADCEQLEYQLRNWALFTWTSGDHIVEQQTHNLDIMRWAFGRDPLVVSAIGGRAVDLPMPEYGNRFSHFCANYDYGDGVSLQAVCRQEPGTSHAVLERFVGTDGILETNLFSGQKIRGKINWDAPQAPNCLYEEYRAILDAVRASKPLNNATECTDSAMLGISGRLSAYSGIKFKYKWAKLRSRENLMPQKLEFGKKTIAPIAVPGKYKLL